MPVEGLNSTWHYRITNAKAGTVLDLSGADNKSIIGYHVKEDANNQHWRIEEHDGKWIFFNKANPDMVLGFGYAPPNNGISLVAQNKSHECKWEIQKARDDTYQIICPDTEFVVDLSDRGNATDGTSIQLWKNFHSENQRWKFTAVPGP